MHKATPAVLVAGLGLTLVAVFATSVSGLTSEDPAPRAAVSLGAAPISPSATEAATGLPTSTVPSGSSTKQATSGTGTGAGNGTGTASATGTGKRQMGQPVSVPKPGRG
jgi:hypothetical protein